MIRDIYYCVCKKLCHARGAALLLWVALGSGFVFAQEGTISKRDVTVYNNSIIDKVSGRTLSKVTHQVTEDSDGVKLLEIGIEGNHEINRFSRRIYEDYQGLKLYFIPGERLFDRLVASYNFRSSDLISDFSFKQACNNRQTWPTEQDGTVRAQGDLPSSLDVWAWFSNKLPNHAMLIHETELLEKFDPFNFVLLHELDHVKHELARSEGRIETIELDLTTNPEMTMPWTAFERGSVQMTADEIVVHTADILRMKEVLNRFSLKNYPEPLQLFQVKGKNLMDVSKDDSRRLFWGMVSSAGNVLSYTSNMSGAVNDILSALQFIETQTTELQIFFAYEDKGKKVYAILQRSIPQGVQPLYSISFPIRTQLPDTAKCDEVKNWIRSELQKKLDQINVYSELANSIRQVGISIANHRSVEPTYVEFLDSIQLPHVRFE